MKSTMPIQILTTDTVQRRLAQLVDEIRRDRSRVLIQDADRPVAAIISIEELELLDRYERDSAEGLRILEEMRRPFEDESPEEIEKEVREALEKVRRDRQVENTRPVE